MSNAYQIIGIIGLVALLSSGCRAPIKRQPLPLKSPRPVQLKFTGEDEGWPPRPRGMTNVKHVPWTPIPGALNEELENQLRRSALANNRARDALGERYAYIGADQVEHSKKKEDVSIVSGIVDLTFYSHSANVAVIVRMKGNKVQSVARRENYQPPEGVDEVKEAAGIARQDHRLEAKVAGLSADGIAIEPRRGDPGHGHRILYVTFRELDADFPMFNAIVDLTSMEVLEAGPSGGR